MANTIEFIIRAIDQASEVIAKISDKTISANKEMVKSFDDIGNTSEAIDKRLSEYGAALDDVTRMQNQLKQAQIEARDAAQELATAQKNLQENTDPTRLDALNRELVDAQVNLDKAGKEVQDLSTKLRDGQAATDDARSGFSKMQAGIVAANQAFDLVGRGIGMVKDVIDQTIGSTVAYAKEVRDLSTNLGITAEETSKIIQASDDYGISVEAVTGALEMAVKRGFAPNVETLAKLADEYNSIQDPVERAARLTDVFGRGWTTLTPMLKEGGKAIRDAAAEAEKLGLVLSDKDVKSARALEVQIDNLNDRVESLKLSMGKDLVPAAINVTDALGKFANIIGGTETPLDRMNRELQYSISLLGKDHPAVKAAEQALAEYARGLKDTSDSEREHNRQIGISTERNRTLSTSVQALNQGVRNQADVYAVLDAAMNPVIAQQNLLETNAKLLEERFDGLKVAIGGALKNEMESYGEKQTDLGEKAATLRAEIEKLEASHGKAVTTTQKATMTDTERAAAMAKLAVLQEDYTGAVKKENETELEFQSRMAETAVKIEDVKGKLGEASGAVTGYIDNSKKIADLKGQYDDINKEIAANAAAHEEATRRIIYGYAEQQLAVGGFTETEFQALDKLAVQMGLKSKEDVAAFEAIRQAARNLAADGSLTEFTTAVGIATDAALGVPDKAAESAQAAKEAMEKAGLKVDVELTPKTDDAAKANFQKQAEGYISKPIEVPIAPKVKPETALPGGLPMPETGKAKESAASLADTYVSASKVVATSITDLVTTTTSKVKGVADTTQIRLATLAIDIASKYNNAAESAINSFVQMSNTVIPEIASVAAEIDKLPTFKQFTYVIKVVGQFPEIPGAQRGADFIVPPNPRGGMGDYFPLLAAPGERVIVQTQAQQMQSPIVAPRGGDTVTYITNVYNPLAAAMLADKQRRDRVARSNARMGVV